MAVRSLLNIKTLIAAVLLVGAVAVAVLVQWDKPSESGASGQVLAQAEPAPAPAAASPVPPLSDRAKPLDLNGNNLIEQGEARGPLDANFAVMDCDNNGGLDAHEIAGFFAGTGCPDKATQVAAAATTRPPLNERAKALDTNDNDLIERDEARGPLEANFDQMDCDKNGGLDGPEIGGFFSGTGCPKPAEAGQTQAAAPAPAAPPAPAPGGPPGGARAPQSVKIDEVRLEATNEAYAVIGRIVVLQSGAIASKISAPLDDISVNVGDRVVKGQTIATLSQGRLVSDRSRVAAQVERQQTMLDNATRELERMKSLRGSAAFSRARFEDLEGVVIERKAQLAEFAAALERITIDIADATVEAPYDGMVIQKHVEAGAYVNVGSPLVTLINDRKLEVEVDVPATRLVGLEIGAPAKIVLQGGRHFEAQVRAILPREDVRTQTRPIRIEPDFKDDRPNLAENQNVTVELPLTNGNRIVTVSKDAVMRRANGNVVFVVEGGNATMRSVELGRGVGDKFQVLDGLKAGDKVVVRGNESLGAGGPVQIVE